MVKTVTLNELAYERLASCKENNESFSDVVLKITGKTSLLDLVGLLSEKQANELRQNIKESRKKMRSRLNELADAL